MKINQISPTINFKKVIEVEKNDYDPYRGRGENEAIVVDILNGKENELYSNDEVKQIKAFFKPLFDKGDKQALFARDEEGRKYIVTGEEAKGILALNRYVEKIKSTPYPPEICYNLELGEYSDGGINREIYDLKHNVACYTQEKIRSMLRNHAHQDKNPVKLKMLEDKKGKCCKIYHFEATQKDENGKEKITTLNLSV